MAKRKSKSKSKSKTKSNLNSKVKESRKKKTQEKIAQFEAGLLGKTTPQTENRHVKIALVMASLIAGLLLVINLDRTTNAAAANKDSGGTSFHGWPAVYLERRYETLPAYLMARKINPWPYPVIESEMREMNYANLWIDIAVGVAIVIGSYFVFRFLVLRYDRWKKTWA